MLEAHREMLEEATCDLSPTASARIGEVLLHIGEACESGLASSILREIGEALYAPARAELERVLG